MNIFVGNLLFEATEAEVRKFFEGFGSVASVAIVMDKKGTKSRGFGFVEMPDDAQAQAAIAVLDGKDFMGRPLNVSPARTKSEAERQREEKKQLRRKLKAEAEQALQQEKDQKAAASPKKGGYKAGRRSRSFMMRRAAVGIEGQAKPAGKRQDNPMRWRKKQEQPKPWQKSQGEAKPRQKPRGESKPWRKSNQRPQRSRFKSHGKPAQH